ncbi:uncharacterized protein LOC110108013 [Dendrobium catenatum]|uniref:uncharacterized protein LOC110108013 n=1 Tax=Dendrobium catenatum TaxID=906689 RepID=UPI0009F4CDCE|nr:uncharacterized protein LOC110108013 [Dendrobium catenatum]
MLILWNSLIASFTVLKSSSQTVIGELTLSNKKRWLVAPVYGSNDIYKRRLLWKDLGSFSDIEFPFIIRGDFNCLLTQNDKMGGKKFVLNQGAQDICAFMNQGDFHNIGVISPKYTWCNNKKGGGHIFERLDRCLLNSSALESIQIPVVRHLAKIASYHYPIIVANSWNKKTGGDAFQCLNLKFKSAMREVFFWSKAKHIELNTLKEQLKKEIYDLQIEEEVDGGLS